MNIEITEQNKRLTWDYVTFPWIGKDPIDGHVVLFGKKKCGTTLVCPSSGTLRDGEYFVGDYHRDYFMDCFIPMNLGTVLKIEL